ncbi:MAG: hypothetical protein ACRDWI_20290 [Jiangellaceae bacterium]
MRWQRLFEDLEAQVEQADQAELGAEVADRTRRELARVRLADRLRAAVGGQVTVRVAGVGLLQATVQAVGPDWLLLAERAGFEALVPLGSVVGITGLGPRSSVPGTEGVVVARLGLAHALRGVARDRSDVRVTLVDGSGASGTVDRVGTDFFELAERGLHDARRPVVGHTVQTVPFAGLGILRRAV